MEASCWIVQEIKKLYVIRRIKQISGNLSAKTAFFGTNWSPSEGIAVGYGKELPVLD